MFGAVNLSYRMISRVILFFFLIWLKCDPLPNYAIVVLLQDDDLVVRMIHHILPQVLFSFYLEGSFKVAFVNCLVVVDDLYHLFFRFHKLEFKPSF